MTCHEVRTLAPLYLSGELTSQQRRACELHLDSCHECEEALERQRACDARLVAALGNDVSDISRIERINEYIRHHISTAQPQRSRKQRWLVPGAVAASLMAAMAGAYTLLAPSIVPPAYTAAAHDHWTEVVEHQPRHWRSTPAEMQTLVAGSGLSLAQVAALAPTGYRLEHAKTCGIAGRRTLHLVFTNGVQEYSLYIRPHRSPKEGIRLIRRNAEEVAGFESGQFNALLVTIGTSTQCEELARLTAARL